MSANGTTRVELRDGQWADIRTKVTIADASAFEKARLSRGEPSELLDSIAVIERLVVAWSYPAEVTPENIGDHLDVRDVPAIIEAINIPNPSTPSSAGTETDEGEESPAPNG